MQHVDPRPPQQARQELLCGNPAEAVPSRGLECDDPKPIPELAGAELACLRPDERNELEVRPRGCKGRDQPPRVRLHPSRLARDEEEQVQSDPPRLVCHRGEIMSGDAGCSPR
jgi:hypothetical protein